MIIKDEDPEFCLPRAERVLGHSVKPGLIQPGKPAQNGFTESFNGRCRDESLNERWSARFLRQKYHS